MSVLLDVAVNQNAAQPRRHRPHAVVAVPRAHRAQERVLDKVPRGLAIAANESRESSEILSLPQAGKGKRVDGSMAAKVRGHQAPVITKSVPNCKLLNTWK